MDLQIVNYSESKMGEQQALKAEDKADGDEISIFYQVLTQAIDIVYEEDLDIIKRKELAAMAVEDLPFGEGLGIGLELDQKSNQQLLLIDSKDLGLDDLNKEQLPIMVPDESDLNISAEHKELYYTESDEYIDNNHAGLFGLEQYGKDLGVYKNTDVLYQEHSSLEDSLDQSLNLSLSPDLNLGSTTSLESTTQAAMAQEQNNLTIAEKKDFIQTNENENIILAEEVRSKQGIAEALVEDDFIADGINAEELIDEELIDGITEEFNVSKREKMLKKALGHRGKIFDFTGDFQKEFVKNDNDSGLSQQKDYIDEISIDNQKNSEIQIAARGLKTDHNGLNSSSKNPVLKEVISQNIIENFDLPMDIKQDSWQPGLGQRILWMVNGKISRAAIHINPPNLGPLDVQLRMLEHDKASVTFTSLHDVTKSAVEQALPKLKEMLENQNIQLVNVDVNVDVSSQRFKEHNQDQSFKFDPMFDASNNHNNSSNKENSSDFILPGNIRASIGLIDYYA